MRFLTLVVCRIIAVHPDGARAVDRHVLAEFKLLDFVKAMPLKVVTSEDLGQTHGWFETFIYRSQGSI